MSSSEKSLHISDLPLEVIACILDFLNHPDVKDARLVCKKWYRASLVSNHSKSELIHVRPKIDVSFLLTSDREFYNLHIQSRNTLWSDKQFWAKLGPRLHSLTADRCKILEEYFYSALSFCSDLRVLKFQGSVRLKRKRPIQLPDFQFSKLCSLVLYNWDFDYSLIESIVMRAPLLKKLAVEVNLLVKSDYYNDEPPSVDVVRFLTNNPQLQFDLKVAYHNFGDDAATTAMLETVLKLPNVRIHNYKTTVHRSLELLKSRTEVKEVELQGGFVLDSCLDVICSDFRQLEGFAALSSNALGPSFSYLYLLQNLTSLELFVSDTVTDAIFLSGLCSEENRKLKKLNLGFQGSLSDNCLVELMRCNPALRQLQLGMSGVLEDITVTDWSVQAVFKYQKLLESFTLTACVKVTDVGLSGQILEHDPTKPRKVNPTGHPISRLKNLRELVLTRCSGIVGSSIVSSFKFPVIQLVRLLDLEELSDKNALRSLIENNPTIECLFLDQNYVLDFSADDIVPPIKQNLRRLRELSLRFRDLSEVDFESIQLHFGTQLRILPGISAIYANDDKDDVSMSSSGPLPSPYQNSDLRWRDYSQRTLSEDGGHFVDSDVENNGSDDSNENESSESDQ